MISTKYQIKDENILVSSKGYVQAVHNKAQFWHYDSSAMKEERAETMGNTFLFGKL